jgi:hypothetical protein
VKGRLEERNFVLLARAFGVNFTSKHATSRERSTLVACYGRCTALRRGASGFLLSVERMSDGRPSELYHDRVDRVTGMAKRNNFSSCRNSSTPKQKGQMAVSRTERAANDERCQFPLFATVEKGVIWVAKQWTDHSAPKRGTQKEPPPRAPPQRMGTKYERLERVGCGDTRGTR